MVHSFEGLADEISSLLNNRGYTGNRGYKLENHSDTGSLIVTQRCGAALPIEDEGLRSEQSRSYSKSGSNQSLDRGVTLVTLVTPNFEQRRAGDACDEFPSEWHAILAEMREQPSPEWMIPGRWGMLLHDAGCFLNRWSSTAHAMGWTALDLFGVHPTRPAVRLDVMGLLLLLQGGEVIALTGEGASIRRPTGAALRFARPAAGAVLLSEAARV